MHVFKVAWAIAFWGLLTPGVAIGSGVAEVPVSVEVRTSDGSEIDGVTIEAKAAGADEVLRWTVGVPSTTQLQLPSGEWHLTTSVEGYWSPPVQLSASAQSPRALLTLWPAGEVRGRWLLSADEQRPRRMKVRFHRLSGPEQAAPGDQAGDGEVECRVLVSAHFRCPVPVGSWNLRLGAIDFAPAYLWKQKVTPEALQVGDLQLRRGGSVSGWLPTCEQTAARTGCSVSLQRMPGGQVLDPQTQEEMRDQALESPVHENGFFQVSGVPAGSYVLEATQQGFAPGHFFPVLVVENRESELREPLLLEPPLELRVQVEPALDPQGQPWSLELFALGERPGHQRTVDGVEPMGLGIWEWRELARGMYKLYVSDGSGQVWHSANVELEPGFETVDVVLPIVRVSGRVLLGDEGLQARLHWPVRLLMETDEEGNFSGLLPRAGEYEMVELRANRPSIRWRFPGVQVEVEPGTDEAWVEFRLPDTTVTGVVVSDQGTPVQGAMILPLADGMSGGAVHADSQGRFRFRGLPEGRAILQAESPLGNSAPVTVEVSEEVERDVRLVIGSTSEVHGVVTGPTGGGIPGAQVIAWSAGMMSLEPVVTRGDGSFIVQLPEAARQASFKIQAPGFPFATRIVELVDQEPVQLEIGQSAGATLLVEAVRDQLDPQAPVSLTLWHNGVFLSLGELLHWTVLHGETPEPEARQHRITRVEAGDWSICIYPLEVLDPFNLSPSEQYCRGGYVAPGGELTLDARPLIGNWRKD